MVLVNAPARRASPPDSLAYAGLNLTFINLRRHQMRTTLSREFLELSHYCPRAAKVLAPQCPPERKLAGPLREQGQILSFRAHSLQIIPVTSLTLLGFCRRRKCPGRSVARWTNDCALSPGYSMGRRWRICAASSISLARLATRSSQGTRIAAWKASRIDPDVRIDKPTACPSRSSR